MGGTRGGGAEPRPGPVLFSAPLSGIFLFLLIAEKTIFG